MHYRIVKKSVLSHARVGMLHTAHGAVRTPCFMPIATRGSIKAVAAENVRAAGAEIVLANTYHLWQRPGLPVIRRFRGLHGFMGWHGPILTDSGGYQVFSLAKHRTISERGAAFVSERDGTRYLLTPERAIAIQCALGSDIMMSLDECLPFPTTRRSALASLELTSRWALRGLREFRRHAPRKRLLFGIVQGATYPDLRRMSAQQIVPMGFDGYALGGLAVGEPMSAMRTIIRSAASLLPDRAPRYLMGVGVPGQIVDAVRQGIDMFDCVLPTRNARHGLLYVWKHHRFSGTFYTTMRIQQSRYSADLKPISDTCNCSTCRTYSRAYVRHLFQTADPLAAQLATIHNIHFYMQLMEAIRGAIRNHTL
ncbi:MAG: tRNA guanosine(34) transglycosylase Tgt [Patescibacteria group bacterium]|nr:tRNA guanosine(34) transglycosylase Tgt [Patescibacteria group bacterium]MDD5715672.1 tRNA guanosine(34) transglycosylase Tgt [Patescibacteria group bacterium]